jgi:hypothetical protein
MLFFGGGFGLVVIAMWIFCVIDVITTRPEHCRNLPKLAWVFIVILLLDVGALLWLVAGRRWDRTRVASPGSGGSSFGPMPTAPGRRSTATNPDDDEEFLAGLRARADEQRRRARGGEPGEQPGEES